MKMDKSLKTVTIYHGLKGEHTDTVADTEEIAYGTVALNEFLRHENVEIEDTTIMFDAICHVEVTEEKKTIEVEDDTCQSDEPTPPTPGEPRIDGANNTSVNQGIDFDLMEGVKAYDGDGNEIPFTVTPDTFAKCEVGQQTFIYDAEGVSKERTITVKQIANPTITGLDPLEVEVGEEFDPLEGVSAVDGNGNEVEVTIETADYPYTLATIDAWSFPGEPEGGGTIPTEIVTILDTPKADDETGEALIKSFVVDGNNLGDVTTVAPASNSGVFVIDTADQIGNTIEVGWVLDTKEVTYSQINGDTGDPTPQFSWGGVTVVMQKGV